MLVRIKDLPQSKQHRKVKKKKKVERERGMGQNEIIQANADSIKVLK